jgi:hypothetical protein
MRTLFVLGGLALGDVQDDRLEKDREDERARGPSATNLGKDF